MENIDFATLFQGFGTIWKAAGYSPLPVYF